MTFVGDFYHHTFDTSRDGNVNTNLHSDYDRYINEFTKMGIDIEQKVLSKSYRCTQSVCDFITDNLQINIDSHKEEESLVHFIADNDLIDEIFHDDEIIKLFYREHYKYDCFSRNWGDCKGENCYNDVCVILNKTSTKHYKKENFEELKPVRKNKLYVACSRAKSNLYLIPEKLIKDYKQ